MEFSTVSPVATLPLASKRTIAAEVTIPEVTIADGTIPDATVASQSVISQSITSQPITNESITNESITSEQAAGDCSAPDSASGDRSPSAGSSRWSFSRLGLDGRLLGSTFLTIFLAELGDKTQLTTLLMSAQSDAPWVVFLGAGTALVATSLIGVWVGCWLANRISPRTLETMTAALLIVISILLLGDVVMG